MKKKWIGLHTFLFSLNTVAVVTAAEAKDSGSSYSGYEAIYLMAKALAGGIMVWGIYDSFFRQSVHEEALYASQTSPDPEWKLRLGKFLFYTSAACGVYFFYWFNVIQCPC